jgi:hypothetical protein
VIEVDLDPFGLSSRRPPGRWGWVPPLAPEPVRSPAQGYTVRRKIALDETAPAGDRLRAIEQIESRALGKPKETVEHQTEESDAERALRELTPEQRLELWKRRGLRAVDEQTQEETG